MATEQGLWALQARATLTWSRDGMTAQGLSVAERIEGLGYRLTAERQEVLDYVIASPEPFTAEDAVRSLPNVGRATVFRFIKLLLDADVICRIIREDGGVSYQVSRRGHHHHLVCIKCGRVQDFSLCTVPQMVSELAHRADFAIEGHRLEIYGHCGACRSGISTMA
jgi:Fe2+ or Zn2+ uptake regulation protein